MNLVREVRAIARLDFAETLRSRWLVFAASVYALLAGVFVLVGLRESSVLGFTGMGRVLLSLCHTLLVVLPLLALTATSQVVTRSREDGTLEVLFSHPLTRTGYLIGLTLSRYLVLAVPLAALIAAMAAIGSLLSPDAVSWGITLRSIVVSAVLLWAFVGLGLAVSTTTRNQARAMVYGLLLWALGVALMDFGVIALMLQWQLHPRAVFLLASLNPVQCARLALLSGLEPELATLGPVGFFLSTRFGPTFLFGLGIVWPLAVGCGSWLAALRSFRYGDVV